MSNAEPEKPLEGSSERPRIVQPIIKWLAALAAVAGGISVFLENSERATNSLNEVWKNVSVIIAGHRTDTQPVTECDRLASSSDDDSHPLGVPGVPSDKVDAKRAVSACQAALESRQYDSRLMYQLARALERVGDAASLREATRLYSKAADEGNAVAQVSLGLSYTYGRGVEQDYVQAMKWYRKAADQGNSAAQNHIGILYSDGHGVEQDYAQAMKWFHKAADQGNSAAQTNIGLMYAYGSGVERDYAQAMKWYRKAADQGNVLGQTDIGVLYAEGQGVAQDYEQAMYWFRKAADQGSSAAQSNIARLYEFGEGVQRDHAEAMKWYRKAADQGNATAQFFLQLLPKAASNRVSTETRK